MRATTIRLDPSDWRRQQSARRRHPPARRWCPELQFPRRRVRAVRHQHYRLRSCLLNDGSADETGPLRAGERDGGQGHADRRVSSSVARPSNRRVDGRERPRSRAQQRPADRARTPDPRAASRTQLKLCLSIQVARTVAPSRLTLALLVRPALDPRTGNSCEFIGVENDESPDLSKCSDQDLHGWAIQASIL